MCKKEANQEVKKYISEELEWHKKEHPKCAEKVICKKRAFKKCEKIEFENYNIKVSRKSIQKMRNNDM